MAGLNQFLQNKQYVKWFSIKEDEVKTIYIPKEVADMHKGVLHSHPKDFKKTIECTYVSEGNFTCNAIAL